MCIRDRGKGTHIVARELYEEGIKPPKSSKDFWSSTMILNILRNEKYVGDLLQKKYVTKDYLTHHKVINESCLLYTSRLKLRMLQERHI